MEFRTIVTPRPTQRPITYDSNIAMLGSCFSDSISLLLDARFFNVLANPLGSLYNPASIAQSIERIVEGRNLTSKDLLQHEGRFHSFACHSSLSATSQTEMLSSVNAKIASAHTFLSSATHIIITLGTAWVYSLRSTGEVVANCHKQPASMFCRTLLSVNDATEEINRAIALVRQANPNITVILTVSPIRHLADGAHGNTLSKSTLHLACHEACRQNENTEYFPAYEIVVDDLRDYRFYAADMCHPSETAVDYIFERFASAYFSEQTQALSLRCLKLRKRLAHRHSATADAHIIERFNQSTRELALSLSAESKGLGSRLTSIINQS